MYPSHDGAHAKFPAQHSDEFIAAVGSIPVSDDEHSEASDSESRELVGQHIDAVDLGVEVDGNMSSDDKPEEFNLTAEHLQRIKAKVQTVSRFDRRWDSRGTGARSKASLWAARLEVGGFLGSRQRNRVRVRRICRFEKGSWVRCLTMLPPGAAW